MSLSGKKREATNIVAIDVTDNKQCSMECDNLCYLGYLKGYDCIKYGKVYGESKPNRHKKCIKQTNIN